MSKLLDVTDFKNAQSVRKPHGGIMMDGQHVADTLTCCHCGKIWVPVKGSGKLRGYCTKCGDVTCGLACQGLCVPMEKRLELFEAGIIKVL